MRCEGRKEIAGGARRRDLAHTLTDVRRVVEWSDTELAIVSLCSALFDWLAMVVTIATYGVLSSGRRIRPESDERSINNGTRCKAKRRASWSWKENRSCRQKPRHQWRTRR